MPLRPELVIFDCDGVLIDSEIISATTLIDLLAAFGIGIDVAYVQENFLGRSFPTVATLLRQQFDVDLPQAFEANYRQALLQRFKTQLMPTEGIVEVLNKLDCQCCVATSSSPERAVKSLKMTGLERFFAGRIHTASQVANGKPAPDLFLYAASCEGVHPSRCVVVEDSLPGLMAAQAAAMKVVRYTGGQHFQEVPPTQPEAFAEISFFDSWAKFFDMFPLLETEQR